MLGLKRCVSEPLGPLTVTVLSLPISISTAAGIDIGIFPIRDMATLPRATPVQIVSLQILKDGAEHLTADTTSPGLVAGHHTLWSADNRDSKAALHSGDIIFPGIHAQARLADPLDLLDRRLSVRAVAE